MRVLHFSDRGPAVALLQLALNRAGFGPLEQDGIFGLRTREALRRFQAANALAVDGVAGRYTHEAPSARGRAFIPSPASTAPLLRL